MTNAELLAKIKAEIEDWLKEYAEDSQFELGERFGYKKLLSFLSTLESETTYDTQQYTPRPSVDIEDVARVQFASHAKVFDKKRKAVFDWEQFKEVAGIFYGFGKKDSSDILESEKPMNPSDDGLKKEIDAYFKDWYVDESDQGYSLKTPTGSAVMGHMKNIARHFAKWGAEHAKIDVTDFCKPIDPGIAQCIADHSWEMLGEDENPVPNDLEEAAKRYAHCPFTDDDGNFHEDAIDGTAYHDFIAGAKWDREQIMKDLSKKIAAAYQLGLADKDRQMMKEAVEGEIQMRYSGSLCAKTIRAINEDKFKFGDKIRIIIIKEEENGQPD